MKTLKTLLAIAGLLCVAVPAFSDCPTLVVTLDAPTDVSYTEATLNATISINPTNNIPTNGVTGSAYFEIWDANNNFYGELLESVIMGKGTNQINISTHLSALVDGMGYYYYLHVQYNQNCFSTFVDGSFTTLHNCSGNQVTTLTATGLSDNGATLNASITLTLREGALGVAWFNWGTSTNYGNTTPSVDLPTDLISAGQYVLTSLSPGVTYHYQAGIYFDSCLIYGVDVTFTTPSNGIPGIVDYENFSNSFVYTNSVHNGPSTGLISSDWRGAYRFALLSAPTGQTTVDSNFTGWTFEDLGSNATTPGLLNGNYTTDPGVKLSRNEGDTANFLVVGWSESIGNNWTDAKAWWYNGNPNSGSVGYFGISGIATNVVIGGGPYPVPTIFGPTPGWEVQGFTLNLYTNGLTNCSPPQVVSLPATGLFHNAIFSGATLNGTVYPNRGRCSAWFDWGTSTAYGNNTPLVDLNSGTIPISISSGLTGLVSGVTYHYRASVGYFNGVNHGVDFTFTMLTNGQGIVDFENFSNSLIHTNSVHDGPVTGLMSGALGAYYFALFSAPTSQTTVDASLVGWNFEHYGSNAAYGYNTVTPGLMNGNYTTDPGVGVGWPSGHSANFLVVGWSANIGITYGDAKAWWNNGNPTSGPSGYFGISGIATNVVIGGGPYPVPTIFGPTPGWEVQGFTLNYYPAGAVTPPVIRSLSQTNGPIAGGTVVTITGTGLANGDTVQFGSTNYSGTGVTVNSSTNLTVTTPAHAVGAVDVRVTDATSGESSTLTNGFNYYTQPAVPNITCTVSSNKLTLGWSGYLGWTLQVQTNSLATGLANNWVDLAGTITNTQYVILMSKTNKCVFYRLLFTGCATN